MDREHLKDAKIVRLHTVSTPKHEDRRSYGGVNTPPLADRVRELELQLSRVLSALEELSHNSSRNAAYISKIIRGLASSLD